jgi:molecular chaperone HtpG
VTATEHGFKAEVQQLLDLMIHSVYSEREVFLRELVSNAADALDKVRFLGLTRSDLVAPEHDELGIRITTDRSARKVVIEDDGIGMTREEVVEHLGTIAKSGTKDFVAKLKEAGNADAPKLIGQFGVGFYSSFMVAEEVEVITRSALPEAGAVRWHSKGAGSFTVEEATREKRGTTITLTLREDAADFSDDLEVKEIVRKHSNYLPWPIWVGTEKANSGKALWAERPSNVTDEEANAFYKNLAADWRDPALRIHVSVDSPIQYHALLFVPEERPYDLFNPRADRGPRLYAKRVLIVEHAADLLPDWLRFVRGVVDSEDIPLNVSREMVQKTPVVRKIRDAITKRILKDLQKLAETPKEEQKGASYASFWREFGALIKEGYYSSAEYRELLLPLLRFNAISHEDGEGTMSLAEYKAGMKLNQDTIWFLAGESREAALASPHLEAFKKRGWDVLLLTDPVDEWLVGVLDKFEDIPLKSVARGDLNLPDEPGEEKADLTQLVPWMEQVLEGAVKKVRTSSRLTDSAAVLVDDDTGISSNMERILRSANQAVPAARRVLELNPKHPLIKNLTALHAQGKTGEVEPLARLLLDDALLLEGNVKDAAGMGRRLQDLLERASRQALGEGTAKEEAANP